MRAVQSCPYGGYSDAAPSPRSTAEGQAQVQPQLPVHGAGALAQAQHEAGGQGLGEAKDCGRGGDNGLVPDAAAPALSYGRVS